MLPLSLLGRTECVRMNILPRLLFLFQSLPVFVSQSTFKLLEKLISKFIWQNKTPRVRLKIVMSGKERGGLGLPNLRLYYWAAQIRAIVAWIIRDPEILWVSIEESSLPGVSLSVLPFLSSQSPKKIQITNLWIRHTVKVWNQIHKQTKGSITLSRAIYIHRNIEFLPSLCDRAFDRWAECGLITISQLFEGNILKTFSQLKNTCTLPSSDLYRFLQIRHYVSQHTDWEYIKT